MAEDALGQHRRFQQVLGMGGEKSAAAHAPDLMPGPADPLDGR